MKLEEIPIAEIEASAMEMKGVLRRTLDGWVCECPETETGYGATPEQAYHEWMRLLYAPYERADAYDEVQRFEHRQVYGE